MHELPQFDECMDRATVTRVHRASPGSLDQCHGALSPLKKQVPLTMHRDDAAGRQAHIKEAPASLEHVTPRAILM